MRRWCQMVTWAVDLLFIRGCAGIYIFTTVALAKSAVNVVSPDVFALARGKVETVKGGVPVNVPPVFVQLLLSLML